jgi:hypothetical protein
MKQADPPLIGVLLIVYFDITIHQIMDSKKAEYINAVYTSMEEVALGIWEHTFMGISFEVVVDSIRSVDSVIFEGHLLLHRFKEDHLLTVFEMDIF